MAGVPHGEHYARPAAACRGLRPRWLSRPITSPSIHGTPIGCAASPGLFLAALAQRTTKLRFGPLVYLLPFYHPLRLIEEVCMLDQMSGGRLELGVGRGVSPFETANYALDFAQTQAMYHEAFQVLLKGLAADELTFEGKFYRFDKVPMILRPVQRPHPPLWYGVCIPDNADWPAENDVNIVSLAPPQAVRPIFERYLAVRKQARQGRLDALRRRPARGGGRHRRSRARDRAARLSALAHEFLLAVRAPRLGAARRRRTIRRPSTNWQRSAPPSPARPRPCAISSPPTSRPPARITWTPWLAFGDMTLAEALHSVDLFAREVMPAFN